MKPTSSRARAQTKTGRAKPAKSPPRAKTVAMKSGGGAARKASKPRNAVASAANAASAKDSNRSVISPGNLLRAGLSALSLPRVESAVTDGLGSIVDSFGLKKLEDVFDHRVATAMKRIGYPSATELNRLADQVAELVKLLRPQKTRR